ncbi:MAG: lipoyl(octanoyl) transferase LipB [Phycisphaera sp.]|nr:MAG: lipoyl(octanoyl) transferase LipB [Phycisphaera sp.]
MSNTVSIEDLGRLGYHEAYEIQQQRHTCVLAGRETDDAEVGTVLLVEHDPVITVTHRPEAQSHITATPEMLAAQGVQIAETDRGGDVTYHGPGQLVVYPIVDLNRMNCRIVEYLRVLEDIVIETLTAFGITGERDEDATGVWVRSGEQSAKVCAMGVRVRRWVTMHGLALNVDPDLSHFLLIVPCGLHGRPVTSLRVLLGHDCPTLQQAKDTVSAIAQRRFTEMAEQAQERRAKA